MSKKRKQVLKGKIINIYFIPDEYDKLFQQFKVSTCRSFSEYIRNVLTNKPIIVRQRNETIEKFLEMAIDLKADLRNIVPSKEPFLLWQRVEEILALMYKIYNECTVK